MDKTLIIFKPFELVTSGGQRRMKLLINSSNRFFVINTYEKKIRAILLFFNKISNSSTVFIFWGYSNIIFNLLTCMLGKKYFFILRDTLIFEKKNSFKNKIKEKLLKLIIYNAEKIIVQNSITQNKIKSINHNVLIIPNNSTTDIINYSINKNIQNATVNYPSKSNHTLRKIYYKLLKTNKFEDIGSTDRNHFISNLIKSKRYIHLSRKDEFPNLIFECIENNTMFIYYKIDTIDSIFKNYPILRSFSFYDYNSLKGILINLDKDLELNINYWKEAEIFLKNHNFNWPQKIINSFN